MDSIGEYSGDNFPDVIYKYRCWSDTYGRRSLSLCEAYFSSSNDFNDPWDCAFDPVFRESNPMHMIERIRGLVERMHPNWAEGKIVKEVQDTFKNALWNSAEHQHRWLQDFREQRATKFGVFSLATDFNVNLMWSHYAAGHSGFCVGYSFESFFSHTGSLKHNGINVFPARVRYLNEYPDWNYLDYSDMPGETLLEKGIEFFSRTLSAKLDDWQYEREIRFLMSKVKGHTPQTLSYSDRLIRLPHDVIREVYLGARMDRASKDEIRQVLRTYPTRAKLYEAKVDRSKNLTFVEVDY